MSRVEIVRLRRWAIATAVALGIAPMPVEAAPPKNEQRQDLMDQLGLPKKQPKPPEPPPEAPDEPPPPAEPPANPPDPTQPPPPQPSPDETAPGKARVTYSGRVRKLLDAGCKSCHASGAMAGSTGFVITGNLDADYKSAKRLVSVDRPESSPLLRKAGGDGHAGGATFAKGSGKYQTLLDWIRDGAPKGGGASAQPPAPKPSEPKPSEPKPSEPKPSKPKPSKPKPKPSEPEVAPSEPPSEPPAIELPEPEPQPLAPTWEQPPPVYAPDVHALLQSKCASCHASTAFAGNTALSLTGDVPRDYANVRALVELAQPQASVLLTKAHGTDHAGGPVFAAQSPEHAALLDWIEHGALGPTLADVPPARSETAPPESTDPVDATTSASLPAQTPDSRLGDGTPVPQASDPKRLPFSLPYHLRLNGRFDISYERRDFKNHPFGPGRNQIQTYHHFLFLSRSGADDPFGFNIELLTQQFYEFNARFVSKGGRIATLIKAGKILVPFGDEPLYHASYGGKTGFDQQLLPVVWSQPGLAINLHITAGPVSISNDTYAIQGYGLRSADGVLNLQGDVSTLEDFRFGVGDRIGISWAPLTAWYSFQFNPLGFDRRLFMQAFDLEFWRLGRVPFLRDLALGLGAMRADVSGGGPGHDYYHFGSYGQIRYYPVKWLYVQYRWGLKTFDNRRGVYFDATRMDERDTSTHNLSIGATYKGMFATLQLFWNLEKANEQDDDFLRLTVGYAF
jgi:hypothetical protein